MVMVDNVSNEREHLIILLRNMHTRQFSELEQQSMVPPFPTYTCVLISFSAKLDDHALDATMRKLFNKTTGDGASTLAAKAGKGITFNVQFEVNHDYLIQYRPIHILLVH